MNLTVIRVLSWILPLNPSCTMSLDMLVKHYNEISVSLGQYSLIWSPRHVVGTDTVQLKPSLSSYAAHFITSYAVNDKDCNNPVE